MKGHSVIRVELDGLVKVLNGVVRLPLDRVGKASA
jgi:hypothetical protein